MYEMKDSTSKLIKERYKSRSIANEVGITETYMSMIVTKKTSCTKPIAYAITKAIDSESEVNDYFERV